MDKKTAFVKRYKEDFEWIDSSGWTPEDGIGRRLTSIAQRAKVKGLYSYGTSSMQIITILLKKYREVKDNEPPKLFKLEP